jgi:hypothetical protein
MAEIKPNVKVILNGMVKDPVAWISSIGFLFFITMAIIGSQKNTLIIYGLYLVGIILMALNFYVRYELTNMKIQFNRKMKEMDTILVSLNRLKAKTEKRPITTKMGVKKR